MARLAVFAAAVFAAAASFAFWWWLGRPVEIADVPGGRLQCLSYTPYEGDRTPLDPDYTVSAGRIRSDLETLKDYTGCIRTYSARGVQGDVVRIAEQSGLQVIAGMWISGNAEDDAEEIAAGLRLAHAHPETVRALVVGNEVLLRRELAGRRLAALIRTVKARTTVPVTYADIRVFWERNPEVAAAVDYITLHILPYWDDPAPVAIDQVQDQAARVLARVRARFPDRVVRIGEIGWPSAGRTRGAAVPSRVNQARFVREFAGRAAALNVDYNIIEALDQPWKRGAEGTVGGHWGLLDVERRPKFPLRGPVSNRPHWAWAFAASAAIGLAILAAAGARGARPLSPARWGALALAGQALGAVLVFQIDFIATTAGSWAVLLGEALAMAVSALAGFVLIASIAAPGGTWATTPPAPIAEVLTRLRRPSGETLCPGAILGLVHGAAALMAAVISVALAFDPRHRDFPIALFAVPAILFACRWIALRHCSPDTPDRREEAWLAFILVGAGGFCLDGPRNLEAFAWTGAAWALALPWLPALRDELRRLRGLVVAARQG